MKPCVYFVEKMECFRRKDRNTKLSIRSLCTKQLVGILAKKEK